MSFPNCLDTKNSEVYWVRLIPRHWTVKALKYVCTNQPSNVDKKTVEGERPVLLCNYTDVYYNDVITSDLSLMKATATDEQIERFTLRSGDVIITKDSETADDIAVSAYVPKDMPGVVCGYHLAMIRPNNGVCGKFIKRLFDSVYIRAKVATLANGLTRVGLSHAAVGGLELPLPPLPEQHAIATFLDRETAKIDALVAEQRRLIELLKEKRQAVISHAVTKGLDPTVPMKDSGIEWLGEVPEHWSVTRLSYFTRIENGSTPSKNRIDYWEEGTVSWVASGEVNQYHIIRPSELITQAALNDHPLRVLPVDTIVIGMIGQGKTRGLAAVLKIEAAINQNLAAVIPDERLESVYLHYIFQSAYVFLREFGRGGQQSALNCEILGATEIPVPPAEEQQVICSYLDVRLADFHALVVEAERAISLLQERRTALISAAVTGKIDVREGVAEEVA